MVHADRTVAIENDGYDALAARLRHEATKMEQAFSPALHTQVMREVASATPASRLRWYTIPLASASAAAVLLVAILIGFARLHEPSDPTVSTPNNRPTPGALAQNSALAEVGRFRGFGLHPLAPLHGYGGLRTDAQRLARYVWDDVNILGQRQ
jgi:hypothetical protein